MGNNFLDNYKKKAEDIGAVSQGEKPIENTNSKTETPIAKEQVLQKVIEEAKPIENTVAKKEEISNLPKEKIEFNTSGDDIIKINEEKKMSFTEDSGFKTPTPKKAVFMADPNAPKKKNTKNIILLGVGAIALILLIFLLTGGASVPNMETWAYSQATIWSNENGVLINKEDEYSDSIPAGTIISQSHAEGEKLGGDDVLTLVVSLGPDLSVMVPVPDLMNMTIDEVEAWVDDNLMTKVRITTEESDTVPIGKMIEYSINDNSVIGTEIRRDSPLYITFSKGEGEGEAVKLPNFLTMSLEESKTFASENNIVLEIVEEFSDTVLKGNVIRQSVKAAQTVYEGDTITIYVSKGEEIRVPNFSSLSKEAAELEANTKGISLIVTQKYVMNVDEGKLVSQSAAAGSLYQDGSYVELVYSLGYRVLVPSFVGQNEENIRTWINEHNAKGAEFKVSTTYTESNKAYGTVLSQVEANNTKDIVATLEFVVSSGPIIYTPSLVLPEGSSVDSIITREKAIAICEAAGIVPVIIEESSGQNRKAGEVWWQSVEAGSQIEAGATITIKCEPMTAAATTTIPNFMGKTKTEIDAMSGLENIILVYEKGEYKADTSEQGKVYIQSQPEGAVVAANTTITLTVYSDIEPTP